MHEHQRSDRNQFLCFRCQSLEGYDAGVRAAAIDDRALFEEATDETDRVNLMSVSIVLSSSHFIFR